MKSFILSQEQIESIPEMLKAFSVPEVADKLGVSVSAVNYWIKRLRTSGVEIIIKRGRKPMKI